MLKAKKPSDYVIATGKSHTVKQFLIAFKFVNIKINGKENLLVVLIKLLKIHVKGSSIFQANRC